MFRSKELAKELGITTSQAITLIALLDFPVINYRIAEELRLFPVGKMQNRVLSPLERGGWAIFHSIPPESGDRGGRPIKAFSLSRGKREVIEKALATADANIVQRERKAEHLSRELGHSLRLE